MKTYSFGIQTLAVTSRDPERIPSLGNNVGVTARTSFSCPTMQERSLYPSIILKLNDDPDKIQTIV